MLIRRIAITTYIILILSSLQGFSQKGYLSLGTKKFGIAFGKPGRYNGIVFSGVSDTYSKGVDLRGILFSMATSPNYVAGLNFSIINNSAKEQAISFNIYNNSGYSDGIAFSLLNGVDKGRGIAISPFWSKGSYTGIVFSTFNNTDVVGCKISALYAGRTATGLVIAPIVAGHTTGLRIAPFNIRYYHRGLMIGILNVSSMYYDTGNTIGGTHGLEIGLFNIAHNGKGFQLGFFNSTTQTERKRIRQIGVFNFNRVGNRTFQFGVFNFINVAHKCKQVGLINIQRSNYGIRVITLFYNQTKLQDK